MDNNEELLELLDDVIMQHATRHNVQSFVEHHREEIVEAFLAFGARGFVAMVIEMIDTERAWSESQRASLERKLLNLKAAKHDAKKILEDEFPEGA